MCAIRFCHWAICSFVHLSECNSIRYFARIFKHCWNFDRCDGFTLSDCCVSPLFLQWNIFFCHLSVNKCIYEETRRATRCCVCALISQNTETELIITNTAWIWWRIEFMRNERRMTKETHLWPWWKKTISNDIRTPVHLYRALLLHTWSSKVLLFGNRFGGNVRICPHLHSFRANARDMIWTVDSAGCNWDKCSNGRKRSQARYEENWRLNPKAFSLATVSSRENWYLSIVNVRVSSISCGLSRRRWNLWWSPLKLNGIYSNFHVTQRFQRFSFHSMQSKRFYLLCWHCVCAHDTTYYQSQIGILGFGGTDNCYPSNGTLNVHSPLLAGISSLSVLSGTIHRW